MILFWLVLKLEIISYRVIISLEGFWFLLQDFYWRFYFCMVKYLNFHNSSSFALRYFLNVNGKVTVWHTPWRIFFGGSQCVLIKFPNESPSSQLMCSSRCSLHSSTTLLSHMLCPKLLSFHLYRWAKGMALLSSNGKHFGSLQHFNFLIDIIKRNCDEPIKMSCCNKKKLNLGGTCH